MIAPSWYWRNLHGGEKGPDVEIIQRRLLAPATGVYDDETKAYVRGLQLMYNLPSSGVVDIQTADAIGESVEASLPPEWYHRSLRKGMKGDDVRALREKLHLEPGERYDDDVRTAVLRYQSAHHLALTGTVNQEVANHIHGLR